MFNLNKAVMLQLSINGVKRDWKAQNYSDEPSFAAKLKIIIDKPADVQANKNYGGDINSHA